jgi:hypothetical protein
MAHVSNLTTAQSSGLIALNELNGQGIITLTSIKKTVTTANIEFEGTNGCYSSVFTVEARLGANGNPINRIEIFSHSSLGFSTGTEPSYLYPEVAIIGLGKRYSYEWRRAVWPKPYWFQESMPEEDDKYGWEDLQQKVSRLHAKLLQKPRKYKSGLTTISPECILNAYREGDLLFTDAVNCLERWKQ